MTKTAYIFPARAASPSGWEKICLTILRPLAKSLKQADDAAWVFAVGDVFCGRRSRSAADCEHAAGDFDRFGRRYRAMRWRKDLPSRILSPATVWANIRHWSRRAFWILPTPFGRFENAARICRKPCRSASVRWRRSWGSMRQLVEAGCAEAAQGQVCSPANINSPSQVVIAGNTEAVDRACEILKEKGRSGRSS